MKIRIFNSTKNEVEKKNYNVFIGISLGVLKPLTKKMAMDYIDWALHHTKDKVGVLVADEIAKFNYQILSGYSSGKAKNRAIKEGDKYVSFFSNVLEEYSKKRKVYILRWADIWDSRKEHLKNILEQEYKTNMKFQKQVLFFIQKYLENRKKNLSQDEMNRLSNYILYELPTLLDGIEFKKATYRLLLYPTFRTSGMSKFVTQIQKQERFPHLKRKLNLDQKTVLVETYLESKS